MAFTQVMLDFEELTADLGKEQLDFFDTRCVAALYRDAESPKRARTESEGVFSAASLSHLAIAVGNTISIFSTSGETGYVCTTHVSDAESILAVRWLADSGLLAVATNLAKLSIFYVATKKFVVTLDLTGEWKSCEMDAFFNKRQDGLALFVSADNGVLYRLVLSGWRSSFARALAASDAEAQLTALLNACIKSLAQVSLGGASFLKMNALSYSMAGGCCTDGFFRLVQQLQMGGPLKILKKSELNCTSVVRARLVGNGTILAALTDDGVLKMIDVPLMMEVDEYRIPRGKDEVITDFAFLEWKGADTDYERIALVVDTSAGTQMQIRATASLGVVAYSQKVVAGACFVQLEAGSGSGESERLAMIVEPADGRHSFTEQRVLVREVVETQPEQRLARLISRGQLDEAERFAIQNGLNVQSVHVARVVSLLDSLTEQPDDELVFEQYMGALENLDEETRGDWVLGAIAPLRKADLIARVIEYGEQKGIGESSAVSLADIAYNFATYRMVFGPTADYGDVWSIYQSADWSEQWMNLLAMGNVAAARIIWQRYPVSILAYLHEGMVYDALRTIEIMLKNFPYQWQFAIDHLEEEVVNTALTKVENPPQIYVDFIDFLARLANNLEKYDPENFPDNALYAVSAVERVVNRQKQNAHTSYNSAQCLNTSSKSVEAIEGMYRRSRDLRAIKRLKETYECPLSYEKFKNLSTKEICHEILQWSVQNPAQVRDRIDRIARPFMEEHSLPADETLLGHIVKVTSIARTQTSSHPLDVHCLLVKDSIASIAIRARAVVRITENAPIPWGSKLTSAVQAVMEDKNIDMKIKNELSLSSDRMKLGSICQDFGLDRGYVDSVIEEYADFVDFTRFLLTNAPTATRDLSEEERQKIVAEAVSIYDRLRPGVREAAEGGVRVDVRETVMQLVEQRDLAGLHKFVERAGVIDETIDMLVLREEAASQAWAQQKDWTVQRVSYIDSINSLIQRHRRNEEKYKGVYEEMNKMRKLMTKYDVDVALVHLREEERRSHLLQKFMKRGNTNLRECLDLAWTLGLSVDDAYLVMLDYSIPMDSPKAAARSEQPDISGGLYLARKALEASPWASTKLLQHVVYVAELTIKRMIPMDERTPMSEAECTRASDDAEDLDAILHDVMRLDTDLVVTERVIRMLSFVGLILDAVLQMQQQPEGGGASRSESGLLSRRNSMDEDMEEDTGKTKKDAPAAKPAYYSAGVSIGLSNRRRVGAYDASMDNPIMERQDVMRAVCAVGFLVNERPSGTSSGTAQQLESMEERWAELFSELNLTGQNVLELKARTLYAVWGGVDSSSVLYPLCTGGLAERLAMQHPCDLPLMATLFATLDYDKNTEALRKLLSVAKKQKKAPQTTLNVCRLAQFLTSRYEAASMHLRATAGGGRGGGGGAAAMPPTETPAVPLQQMQHDSEYSKKVILLRSYHDRAMWEKRLAKRGGVAHLDGTKAIADFAAQMIPPETVREYLLDLPLSKMAWSQQQQQAGGGGNSAGAAVCATDKREATVCTGMRAYVERLLEGAVASSDAMDRDAFLCTADATIAVELAQPTYDQAELCAFLSEGLVDFLEYSCCPYAHEVISFVLAKLAALSPTEDGNWKRGKMVIDFLGRMPRGSPITAEERVWYTERKAMRNMAASASSSESLMLNSDTHLPQLPAKAATRLPFHLLLCTGEVELAKFVVPLVWSEITLGSLQDWYGLLKSVQSLASADSSSQKMNLKRQKLIAKAVMKFIWAAQKQDDKLSAQDMEDIQQRLYEESQVLTLIHAFGVEVAQYVPAGPTRIQLLELGYNVTKKYLQDHKENSPTRQKIEDSRQRTLDSLREMKTKQLLQTHRVLNEDTSPYLKNVDVVISRIYDRFINWDEPADVEKKCALIAELAEVNEHDLESTHAAIIVSWLCGESGSGGEGGDEGRLEVDMNDTMGSESGLFGGASDRGGGGAKDDDDDFVPIPFFDGEVTRIVHVLRISTCKQRLVQNVLLNYVNMENPPGGYSTYIRAVSALLRALSERELEEWAPCNRDEYSDTLYTRLDKRLVERTLGAAAYAQFEKAITQTEKLHLFIRSLLLGTQRSKPGSVHLATLITMDSFDKEIPLDQKLVDHMLAKLNSERKYSLLATFLKFCSSKPSMRSTRNLSVLWGRTIDNAMRELEDESTPISTIHEWLLFALSCPAPANRAFESIRRLMEQRGAGVASYLLKQASTYTTTGDCAVSEGWRRAKNIDYPIHWATKKEVE